MTSTTSATTSWSARLVNRGTDLDTARSLVSMRDRQDAVSAILRQLNNPLA